MPKITSSLAKTDDGTIQITFTIPVKVVEENKEIALKDIAKSIEIPGFRKGKAPTEKVKEKVSQKILFEKVLNQILPRELSRAFINYKIQPIMYPRVELLSDKNHQDWQVRITTCELPEITLGDYKSAIKNSGKTQAIWTPAKGELQDKPPEKLNTAEKEQAVVKAILTSSQVTIPKPLIDEEVNSRLAKLLEQIEKLGITLESYLTSVGKSADSLRKEYEQQAKDSLKIELALNKIAAEEKVDIKDEDIDSAIKTSTSADPALAEKLNAPEQRRVVAGILKRRRVLNQLSDIIP